MYISGSNVDNFIYITGCQFDSMVSNIEENYEEKFNTVEDLIVKWKR